MHIYLEVTITSNENRNKDIKEKLTIGLRVSGFFKDITLQTWEAMIKQLMRAVETGILRAIITQTRLYRIWRKGWNDNVSILVESRVIVTVSYTFTTTFKTQSWTAKEKMERQLKIIHRNTNTSIYELGWKEKQAVE